MVLRFIVRLNDGEMEADVHVFGQEAETFLGVTAEGFHRSASIQKNVLRRLKLHCSLSVPAPSQHTALPTNNTGSSAVLPEGPLCTMYPLHPLYPIRLFSYLSGPLGSTGRALKLAVTGTILG